MNNTEKILAFMDAQKFVRYISAALLLYRSDSKRCQDKAFSLVKSQVHQGRIVQATAAYKSPPIYIRYQKGKKRRKSPRKWHDLWVNDCAALHAYNTQLDRKGNVVRPMVIPEGGKKKGEDFKDPKCGFLFEVHTGSEDYCGDRKIKQKLSEAPKGSTFCWIVTGEVEKATRQQQLNCALTLFRYTQRFTKEHPEYNHRHYFILFSDYLAGERRAWSHPEGKGRKIFV